jgi:hypothetical protein
MKTGDQRSESIMLQVLEHINRNTTPAELRSTAGGALDLYMLAAKLTSRGVDVVHSTKWKMADNGNITVTFNAPDQQRYGEARCTVSRDQFEAILLTTFGRKIYVSPLSHHDWEMFRTRLKGMRKPLPAATATREPRHSRTGSSLGHF